MKKYKVHDFWGLFQMLEISQSKEEPKLGNRKINLIWLIL